MSPYTPAVYVEFAFGYGALADTTEGSWTNVTAAYPSDLIVDDINIQRGRENELDLFSAGTATVSFKDRLRILDPSNTAGPYYGNLKPRTPMRVRAVHSSTDYIRFRGYVDGWPVQSGRGQNVVNVVATDAFKIFAGTTLPNIYDYEVLADSPNAYWRLGEETGERAVDSSTTRADGTYINCVRGQESVVPYGGDGSIGCTVRDYQGVIIVDESAKVGSATTGSMTIEMWIKANEGADDQATRLDLYRQGSGGSYAVGHVLQIYTSTYIDALPAFLPLGFPLLTWVLKSITTPIEYWWDTPTILDGNPHHIVVVVDVAGGEVTGPATSSSGPVAAAYMDGAALPLVTPSTSVAADSIPYSYVGAAEVVVEDLSFDGLIDNVALYRSALSATRIAEHYEAGVAPWDAETTGVRIGQVLDLIGWPAGLRDIDTGEMLCGPADTAGHNTLEYLQSIVQTEQGRLFMSHDGKVTFHQRDRFLTEATESTSQFTFSDDGAGDAVIESPTFDYDERKIYNRASVTREGGDTQVIDDTSSQAIYGVKSFDLSGLALRDDRFSRAIADYIVWRYADPQVRVGQWALQPELDAASWADVFGLAIGHRVTVENKPANTGTQLAVDMHIESISERINPRTWHITFSGSPVDPNAANYFTWGGNGATQGWGVGVWR